LPAGTGYGIVFVVVSNSVPKLLAVFLAGAGLGYAAANWPTLAGYAAASAPPDATEAAPFEAAPIVSIAPPRTAREKRAG
jgi:hypothetical protein